MFLLQGFITHAYNDAVRQREGELFENDSFMIFRKSTQNRFTPNHNTTPSYA